MSTYSKVKFERYAKDGAELVISCGMYEQRDGLEAMGIKMH